MQQDKAYINLELYKNNITITYEKSLEIFRNQVNHNFDPEMFPINNNARHINELRYSGKCGRGKICGCGRGRHGRGGRNYGQGHGNGYINIRGISNIRMVKCTDATQTEVHPSYEFTESEWGILLEAKIHV